MSFSCSSSNAQATRLDKSVITWRQKSLSFSLLALCGCCLSWLLQSTWFRAQCLRFDSSFFLLLERNANVSFALLTTCKAIFSAISLALPQPVGESEWVAVAEWCNVPHHLTHTKVVHCHSKNGALLHLQQSLVHSQSTSFGSFLILGDWKVCEYLSHQFVLFITTLFCLLTFATLPCAHRLFAFQCPRDCTWVYWTFQKTVCRCFRPSGDHF